MAEAWRLFVVDGTGSCSRVPISWELDAGYDILTDDGYPADKAAEMLVAAEREGRDPEQFARHMVKLRQALRTQRGH